MVLIVAAVVVMLVTAALGAGSSMPPLLQPPDGTGSPPAFIPPTEMITLEPEEGLEERPELPDMPSMPGWLVDVLWILALCVVIPVLVVAIVRLIQAQLAIRRRQARTPDIRFTEVTEGVDEMQLAESFAEALAALRGGVDVDAAILECWRRMEALAADTGIRRSRTQTPTEFTVDVLANSAADPVALETLADLYRRAAFSAHHLGDADRDDAVAALDALHASLVVEAE